MDEFGQKNAVLRTLWSALRSPSANVNLKSDGLSDSFPDLAKQQKIVI